MVKLDGYEEEGEEKVEERSQGGQFINDVMWYEQRGDGEDGETGPDETVPIASSAAR